MRVRFIIRRAFKLALEGGYLRMKHWFLALLVLLTLCLCTVPALAAENEFSFDRTVTTVFEGDTLATVLNRTGDAAQGEVTYTSSAEKNATVDAAGVVTALQKGKTTITATLKTEERSYRATVTITIVRRVTEIEVNEDSLSVYAADDPAILSLLTQPVPEGARVLVLPVNRSQKLGITALPKDANDRKTTLSTDSPEICDVTGSTLKPQALGECNVTITSQQNPEITFTYHVLVVQPITKLTLSLEKSELFIGETTRISTAFTPEDATMQQVIYSSRNEEIATVDQNGLVTALKKGTVTLDAAAADGSGRTASIRLTVKQQPESITLSETSFVINVGKTKRITAQVLPAATNDKSVTWTSSDESVATVTSNGTVKPVAPGACTITCASKDLPQVYATATVEVHQLVTRVAFLEKSLSFDVNTTCQTYWEIEPANATDQSVTFSSSNEKIATVDENGLITGLKRGSCTITVKTADGSNRKATIKINVLQPVTGVHMEKGTYRVGIDEGLRIKAVLEPSDASNTNMTWSVADSSIASVRGSNNRPVVTGKRWGTTTVTGVTEDGGFSATATIKTGNYNKAVQITDLYVSDNKIKIVVKNESNMNITKFFFDISCYDMYGNPLPCCTDGTNTFGGSYGYTLYEGDSTEHGKFYFSDFVQPETPIGRVVMTITGYRADDGYSHTIPEDKRQPVEFKSATYTPPAAV